jgi:hypothetical protein
MKKEKKSIIKLILTIIVYILFFIYEILEKTFNYILLHIKFIKDIIQKTKNKLYSSSFYNWLKIKVDAINEKTFLFIIVFLIITSALMIYILPFIISSSFLKILSVVVGKILSTLNIILNSIGIKKIFKIPTIRLFRMRVNRIKRVVKYNFMIIKNQLKSYLDIFRSSNFYKTTKEIFLKIKNKWFSNL